MRTQPTGSQYAWHIVLLYVVLASVWTLFWHRMPPPTPAEPRWIQIVHGVEDWLFAIASAAVLVLALTHLNRRRYHFVFDNLGEGFAYWRMPVSAARPDPVCLDANRAFAELTGIRGRVVGKRASALDPDLRLANPDLMDACARVARTGESEHLEIHADRSARWLAVSVSRPSAGHCLAVFDDITARKKAEDRLHTANALLEIQMSQMRALQEQLRDRALNDPVMHIHNRSYLDEILPLEAARARRRQDAFGVLLIDVDHFKQINDTYGHAVGDAILQAVARTLTRALRASDTVCRYGGDEILCLLPGAGYGVTRARAEHLVSALAETRIDHADLSVRVTCSIGAAVFPQHGADARAVVQAADLALYAAKAAGRNRAQMAGAGTQFTLDLRAAGEPHADQQSA
jgi:diguanylate cyclase (GGDEF)-like protein